MAKERPILFSAPMVRALLEGRKTVTRRAAKFNAAGRLALAGKNWHIEDPESVKACPYGQPGDRLWVRETMEADEETSDTVILSRYAADRAPVLYAGCDDPAFNGSVAHWKYPRLSCPSIHMPRWASRLSLEITGVKVERLQDITEEQARAEGVLGDNWEGTDDLNLTVSGWGWLDYLDQTGMEYSFDTARESFRTLWESINGPGSWDANPWVWAVSFTRLAPMEQA